MNLQIAVTFLSLLFSFGFCEFGTINTTFDYNYPNTTLLDVTDIDDQAYPIDLNFSFAYGGVSHQRFYICSNSYVTFVDEPCTTPAWSMTMPMLFISSMNNFALSIIVTTTSDNATISYRGRRFNQSETGEMFWKLTFFKGDLEKFGLDILSNNMSNKDRGWSDRCNSQRECYSLITTSKISGYIYLECAPNLVWDGYWNVCSINCTAYRHASFAPQPELCVCENKYKWQGSVNVCVIDCGSIPYADTNVSNEVCSCSANFTWDWSLKDCKNNCSKYPQAWGSASTDSCTCESRYEWHGPTLGCVINCTLIDYAISNISATGCSCQTNFTWVHYECRIACTNYPNALDYLLTITSCQCMSRFYWVSMEIGCVINCSLLNHTTSNSSLQECACEDNFYWDTNSSACVINCTLYANSITVSSITVCGCVFKYSWRDQYSGCVVDCSFIDNANGSNNLMSSCECVSGYAWGSSTFQCIPLAKAVGGRVGIILGIPLSIIIIIICGICICVCIRNRPPNTHPPPIPPRNSVDSQCTIAPYGTIHTLSAEQTEQSCTICLMGNVNYLTRCKHCFHKECLRLWMTKQRNCPNCRSPLQPI